MRLDTVRVFVNDLAQEAKGVAFSGAPEPQAWGGTLATFMDPAGNRLQLVQQRAA